MQGWIFLHRKIFENAISRKPNYLAIWIYLLTNANFEDNTFIWNNENITIRRGQFIGSIKQISDHFRLSTSTVSYVLDYLENEEMIIRKSNKQFTLFEICEYDLYQKVEIKVENDDTSESLINKGLNGYENKKLKSNLRSDRKQVETTNNNNNKNNIYSHIFSFWNSRQIRVHGKLDVRTESKIKATLKEYSSDEIKTAINNYSIILKSEDYYFSYVWTLKDFLSRGIENFIDLEIAKSNYKKNEKAKGYTQQTNQENKFSELRFYENQETN